MPKTQTVVADELNQLRAEHDYDFSAVARLDRRDNRIRMDCLSGNISDRTQQMTKKPGAGITGHVIRFGRPFVLDASNPMADKERLRYPIMIAEKLASVLAVPLAKEGMVIGVLVAGNRASRIYTPIEIKQASKYAERIAELC